MPRVGMCSIINIMLLFPAAAQAAQSHISRAKQAAAVRAPDMPLRLVQP